MLLFGWTVLSLLAAFIARSKARSFKLFFLLSMVLSPLVGIPASIIVKTNKEKLDADAFATGKLRRCHACSALANWNAYRCPSCDADLEPTLPPTKLTIGS